MSSLARQLAAAGLVLACTGAAAEESVDPWQGFNERVFVFNEFADRVLLRPVSVAYRYVLPEFAERGVHNVLENLEDPGVALNQLLQGKPSLAASDAGRFLLNSTVGVVGLIDVATTVGLPAHEEDFGQTLNVWGIGPGPFLMLPLMGPSSPTGAVGRAVDMLTQPTTWVGSNALGYTVTGVDIIDTRAELLDAESLITGDRYTFLRDAYVQRRNYLQADGVVEDAFLDDVGDDEEAPPASGTPTDAEPSADAQGETE